MKLFIIAGLICSWSVRAQQPAPKIETKPATPASVAPTSTAPRNLRELSNLELIELLPPARQELQRTLSGWVDNPAVVEWERRMVEQRVTDEELGKALLHCQILRGPAKVAQGAPYYVWFRMPRWLIGVDGEAVPKGIEGGKAEAFQVIRMGCGNAIMAQEERESRQLIGVLPANTKMVTFQVRLTRNRYGPGEPKLAWSGEVVLPVEFGTMKGLEPCDTPELLEVVKANLKVSCSAGHFHDGPAAWPNVWFNHPTTGLLGDKMVSVRAELLRDGKVIASRISSDPDELFGDARLNESFTSSSSVSGEVAIAIIDRKQLERFEIRVTGFQPDMPSKRGRTKYWSGSFSLPLAQVLEPECGMRPAK